jgi:hypothetical protein
VFGVRRREALGSGGQVHEDARVWLRASYVAVLGLLDYGAADDIHSREDVTPTSVGGPTPMVRVAPAQMVPVETAQTAPVKPAQTSPVGTTVPVEASQTVRRTDHPEPPGAPLPEECLGESTRSDLTRDLPTAAAVSDGRI